MTATAVQDRNGRALEYLELLRSLAAEMERAMRAIAHNALADLEESVSSQQNLSARLMELAGDLSATANAGAPLPRPPVETELMQQVRQANASLQALNRRYAALLEHSSRSVVLLISLYSGFQGERFQGQLLTGKLQEASGPRLKHQTWSCQM